MNEKRFLRLNWVLFFIFLAALPTLACTTFFGSAEEEASAAIVKATIVSEQVAPAEPAEEVAELAQDPPTIAPTEDASEDAGDLEEDPLGTILKAQGAGLDVDSVRMTITNENLENGETMVTIIEFVRPERFHIASDGFEIIVIEDKTYMNDGAGNWLESPVEMTGLFEGFLDAFTNDQAVDDLLDDLSINIDDVNFQGEETINGRPALVYEYLATSLLDSEAAQTKVWVGADDGLLYQQVIEANTAGERSRLTMLYEYDDVAIESPIQ